ESETIINKRLHAHFKNNYHHHLDELRTIKKKAILFVLIGMCIMIGAGYISFLKSENFFVHSLLVMLEPAGWFSVWYGFEHLFRTSKRETPELNFYTKISK